jgi:ethanolamine utilization cobalamin adenosyltransferase
LLPPGTRFSPSAIDFIKHWNMEVTHADRESSAVAGGTDVTTASNVARSASQNAHRMRLHAKIDTLQSLCLLIGARARAQKLPQLADHLGALAAYCREIKRAERDGREVGALELAGLDGAALQQATSDLAELADIEHIAPGPLDHEILHWLNYLHCQARETKLVTLDVFGPPHLGEPHHAGFIRALDHLSGAVHYLGMRFKTGDLAWSAQIS